MKVMFICTGNICRSAMAEALFKNMSQGKNIEVCSCGIFADNGDGPTQNAIETMKDYGIDLSKHRATNIRKSKIQEMDLILCATYSHKITVLQMYPNLKEKVFTIKEYAGIKDEIDIKDPWGYDLETYRKCAEEIKSAMGTEVFGTKISQSTRS